MRADQCVCSPAAALFERFGNDRGDMMVAAHGHDAQGRSVRARWSLVAEAGDGPFVPTLPALAAIRALAAGRFTQRGAFACVGVLPLEGLEVEISRHSIATKIMFHCGSA
jgi:hypothetical protein